MEGLLRGQKEPELGQKELEELFQESFQEDGCILFPVRHHSPACSYHIKKLIQEIEPEVVLIEGPENATELIPFIISEQTKAPFCIYLSFDDKEGRVSGEPDKYRAYYPFLDYSPELVALREAGKKKIPCQFIDLSYGEKLLNSKKEKRQEDEYEKEDDWGLGKYYERLTQKTGCRNFNELWEMLFEINGCHIATREFARNVFAYCYYCRCYSDEEKRLLDGDIARESMMKQQLKEALKTYKKILVVTGGMHTIALAKYIQQIRAEEEEKISLEEIIRLKKEETPVYLMPYSYEESDQASGYESGMVFPFFYQKVWESVEKKKKLPYEEAVLQFIIKTAGAIRKKQALSIADEMQSYYMARGLASLREKKECGVFELIDAVKASFVKGEMNSYYQPALKGLIRLITGMTMGKVDKDAGVPPIVEDFYMQCHRFRIQTNTTLKKETKLDVYNKAEHREKSRFFRQMQFLNTNFCTYQKSQEDNGTTGRILLRESWEYRYSPSVQAALIQVSVYGGTLRRACMTLMRKKIKEKHHTAGELSMLLLLAEQMGIYELFESLMETLIEVIGNDMDFLSVMDCFERLCMIERKQEQYTKEEKESLSASSLVNLKKLSLNRGLTLFYTVLQVKKGEEDEIIKKIKYLYQYFIDRTEPEEEEFLSELTNIYQDTEINGALLGAASGILLKKERILLEDVFHTLESYIHGTDEVKKIAAAFLKGFFLIAKDVIFVDDRLLLLLNEILKDTEGELFLSLLPDLRLAFTYFLPFETDRIAKQVASLYGVSVNRLLYEKALDQEELEEAIAIDQYCLWNREKWLKEKQSVNGQGGL